MDEPELDPIPGTDNAGRKRARWRLVMLNLWLAPMGLVAVLAGIFLFYILWHNTPPSRTPSGHIYKRVDPQVSPAIFCPGDTIRMQVEVELLRAPMLIAIGETIWDRDRHYTVIPGQRLTWYAYTQTGTVHREDLRIVPQLRPGNYEYRAVADEFGTEASGISFPFTVPNTCTRSGPPWVMSPAEWERYKGAQR